MNGVKGAVNCFSFSGSWVPQISRLFVYIFSNIYPFTL